MVHLSVLIVKFLLTIVEGFLHHAYYHPFAHFFFAKSLSISSYKILPVYGSAVFHGSLRANSQAFSGFEYLWTMCSLVPLCSFVFFLSCSCRQKHQAHASRSLFRVSWTISMSHCCLLTKQSALWPFSLLTMLGSALDFFLEGNPCASSTHRHSSTNSSMLPLKIVPCSVEKFF